MTCEQVHELAKELKVSPEIESEMQIVWGFARELYEETAQHSHECLDCGRVTGCRDRACEVDRAYNGRSRSCGRC